MEITQVWASQQMHEEKMAKIRQVIENIKTRNQQFSRRQLKITFKPSRRLEMGLVDFRGFKLRTGFFGKVLLDVSDVTDQWFVREPRIRNIVREELSNSFPDQNIKLYEL